MYLNFNQKVYVFVVKYHIFFKPEAICIESYDFVMNLNEIYYLK